MNVTRASFEAELLAGSESMVKLALSDYTTGDAPDSTAISAWLNWSILAAIEEVGFTSATPDAVSNSDLSVIPETFSRRVKLWAKIDVANNLLGCLLAINLQQGTDKEDLTGLTDQLKARLASMKAVYDVLPGVGRMTSAVGGPMGPVADRGPGGQGCPTYPRQPVYSTPPYGAYPRNGPWPVG